ncbi:MAG TPA: hypothetical protein VJW77_10850 [Terriglobia bacterium]|nr:hypothetical protein [Terriglobia bacterium]
MLRLKRVRVGSGVRAVGALLLIPTGLLIAQGPGQTEKNIVSTVAPRVSISNLAGKVMVRGWDRLQVHVAYASVSPKVGVDTEQVPSKGPADKVHFTSYLVDRSVPVPNPAVDYIVDVPLGASLEIHDPQGEVKINSVKGDTSVDSLSGGISVADSTGHLSLRSVGGNIEIIRSSGRVEAYTINGNLHFVNPASKRLRGTTTSGTIIYEGDFAPGGDYILSDYSGDITVLCPSSASFELDAKTVRGKLDNQFQLVPRGPAARSFLPPGNSIFGTQGSGQATLEVTSFSGVIHIRQQ